MKNKLSLFLTAVATVGVCVYSESCIRAAADALALCARALVPSLFVFFVLSGLLVRLGLPAALEKPLSGLCRPLFGVGGSGAAAVLLGFLSGYPVGTVCIKTLYQGGSITKTEAKRLLAFCNNSGPLFVLGTVGAVLLESPRAGAVLYLSHTLAAFSVGILFRFYHYSAEPEPRRRAVFHIQPLRAALGESVRAAVENIFYVCGFTVLFSVLLAMADAVLPQSVFLSAVLEMTNGCSRIAALPLDMRQRLRLLSLVLGFGGISVHLQLAGILADTDLSVKTCVIGKLMQAVISYIYVSCFWWRV